MHTLLRHILADFTAGILPYKRAFLGCTQRDHARMHKPLLGAAYRRVLRSQCVVNRQSQSDLSQFLWGSQLNSVVFRLNL